MRMWEAWSAAGDRTRPIGPDDFEVTGGLANALSRDADEIYAAFNRIGLHYGPAHRGLRSLSRSGGKLPNASSRFKRLE